MLSRLFTLFSATKPASEVQEQDEDVDVAFQAQRGSSMVGVLYPDRSRISRIEPEVQVFCLIYREHSKCVRYLELHGDTRREFGPKVPMWTIDTQGRRDDELMAQAIEDGKNCMHAMRNPVVVSFPERDTEAAVEIASAVSIAVAPSQAQVVAVAPEQPSQPKPVLVVEGRFIDAAHMPWMNPNGGKPGRPGFAVILGEGDDLKRYYGSDLQRAVAEAKPGTGDIVRLSKYPAVRLMVGTRSIEKNIWTVDVVKPALKAA